MRPAGAGVTAPAVGTLLVACRRVMVWSHWVDDGEEEICVLQAGDVMLLLQPVDVASAEGLPWFHVLTKVGPGWVIQHGSRIEPA